VDSDIDLFLVMPDGYDRVEGQWEAQLQLLEDRVLAWTGNRLEVLVLDRSHLADVVAAGEPVLGALREEAFTLYGPEVSVVLAGARRSSARRS
jgi:hypothetical protein